MLLPLRMCYLVIKAVLEQSSGLIFTCQYAELASSLEYHTFPAKVSRHLSTRDGIDTGTNRPVKQRIRRTPLGFAGEEEAQLKKMLSAGVIRPSVSEWASAPVLIRKR
jgi:hypothetical protein